MAFGQLRRIAFIMTKPLKEKNRVLKTVANIISVLLHPMFMPIYCTLLWHHFSPQDFVNFPAKKLSGLWGMMLINTLLFPAVLVLLLKGLGFIKSILMKETKERMIPLIGIMIFYFWPYLVAKNLEAPEAARILLLGNFWAVIVVFVATLFTKISMHSSGIGTAIGFVFVLSLLHNDLLITPLALCLFAAISIVWARHYLAAHSKLELALGLISGIVAQFAAYLYLQ